MGYKKPSFIENIAEKIGLIPNLHKEAYQEADKSMMHFSEKELAEMYKNFPPPEKWDNWVEYDPKVWPKKNLSDRSHNLFQLRKCLWFNRFYR